MFLLVRGLCWILVGVVFSGFHLFLLHRSLVRITSQNPTAAGRQVAKSFPLRLILLTPFLLLVARQGLVASGGLVLGSLLGPWLLFIWGGFFDKPLFQRQG